MSEKIEALIERACVIRALLDTLIELDICETQFLIERIDYTKIDVSKESFTNYKYNEYIKTIYVYSGQDYRAMLSFVKLLRDFINKCDEKSKIVHKRR